MLTLTLPQVVTQAHTRNGAHPRSKRDHYLTTPIVLTATSIEKLIEVLQRHFNIPRDNIGVVDMPSRSFLVSITTRNKNEFHYTDQWATYKKRFEQRGSQMYFHCFTGTTEAS